MERLILSHKLNKQDYETKKLLLQVICYCYRIYIFCNVRRLVFNSYKRYGMSQLKKLQSWLSSFKKVNNRFPDEKEITFKIKDLLKEEVVEKKTKFGKVHFRDSKWSDYNTLRQYLAEDKIFVEEYAGVDLKAYIESALAWSEKGNTTTDNGWLLTLKNWIRRAKSEGRLIKRVVPEKQKGHVNY